MRDIAQALAIARKELNAIKAGFGGDQTRFSVSEITQTSFVLNAIKPVIIRVDFQYQDFPQLYVRGISLDAPLTYSNLGTQKTLYEWYISPLLHANNQLDCTLISQYPPTVFVMEDA